MTGRRDFFPLLSLLIFLSLYGCNNAANKVSDNDIDAPQTTASIPGGLYNTPQSVKLVCLDIGSGCSVSYYTTDNSEPDTNSTKYSGAISISSTANLRFFSMDKAGNREPAKSESYTIDQVAPSVKETISDPIIDVTASFSLVFDESMTPQSLTLGGDLADKANSSWSQKALANDTLTISAKNQWPLGTAQNLTIDATDLAGNSLPSQTLRFDIGVLHVSADDANAKDSNIGTQAQPFKTIVAAVNQAVATLSKSEIRVAQGNYTTFTQSAIVIDVPDGMRLLGGYSSDWASRNPVTTPSVVQDVSSDGGDFNNPNCVFTINAGAGSETLLDGFTIAGGSGTGASCGVLIDTNASPTISDNTISGGSAASSTGIIDRGLSPVIENNNIRGSDAGAQSNALTGISSNGSSPTIAGNSINAGSGEAGRSGGTGISLTDVNALVEKNAVVGGNAEASYGITISGASTVIMRNNTVHGGNSYNTYGVNIGVGTTVTLQNNTIYSGPSTFEVALNLGAPAIIENNIIFASMCVNETNADADPIRMFANDLYGCDQRFFYFDFDGQCTGNADGDGDAQTCTLAEMNQLTDMQVDSTNINVDLGFGIAQDSDWHLSTATSNLVKFGGLDLSTDFSTDKDGAQRTAPWSMGAYEKD